MVSKRFKRIFGFSLIETVVTLGVVSIVILGAYQIFREGIALFKTNQASADGQVAALMVLGRITSEVSVADKSLVRYYPAGGPVPAGIVFATSLSDTGITSFHPLTGEVYWQKYVCFYFAADPSGGLEGAVYRREESIPDEPGYGPGDSRVSQVEDGFTLRNTNYFKSSSTLPKRLIGKGIYSLDISPYTDTTGATTDTYNIVVEAGDPTRATSTGFYIKVESKVTPRG